LTSRSKKIWKKLTNCIFKNSHWQNAGRITAQCRQQWHIIKTHDPDRGNHIYHIYVQYIIWTNVYMKKKILKHTHLKRSLNKQYNIFIHSDIQLLNSNLGKRQNHLIQTDSKKKLCSFLWHSHAGMLFKSTTLPIRSSSYHLLSIFNYWYYVLYQCCASYLPIICYMYSTWI